MDIRKALVVVTLATLPIASMAELSKPAVRRIANQEITKRAPGLIGAVGPRGPAGIQGPAGRDGAGFLYVYVRANGAVDASRSFGISQANVVRVTNGGYFICGISQPRGAQITVSGFESAGPGNTPAVGIWDNDPDCQVIVGMWNIYDGAFVDGGFFLTLY